MDEPDLYKRLNVTPDVKDAELKRAYRIAVRKYHPDVGGEFASEDRFQEIVDAYAVLSQPKLRKIYDLKRRRNAAAKYQQVHWQDRDSSTARAASVTQRPSPNAAKRPYSKKSKTVKHSGTAQTANSHRKSKSDPRTSVAFKAGKTLGYLFNSRLLKTLSFKGQRAPFTTYRESDKTNELPTHTFSIDALESIQGTVRELVLGSGNEQRLVRVKIPPGIHDQATIRVGKHGVTGKPLMLAKVSIRSHSMIEREDCDIILKLPITVKEAIEGFVLDAPAPGRTVRVVIPPLAQAGKRRLRVKGRGLPRRGLEGFGDLYVEPYIVLPKRLNEIEKRTLSQLESRYDLHPRTGMPKSL